MTETDRKEESWIRKLPVFIVVLTVLIFIIIVIRDHNQYIKWEEDQTELTGKFKQTSEELVLLREAQGSLQEISEKVETLEQQAADLTTTLEKLVKEKNNTDSALSKQRQEMKNLNGQILTSKNQVAELTKERETINYQTLHYYVSSFFSHEFMHLYEWVNRGLESPKELKGC